MTSDERRYAGNRRLHRNTQYPIPIRVSLAMAIAAAVAIALYAPALRFGFFNDDPTGHFRWMGERSVLSFFVDASGHGYYRPVSFALWQALYRLMGRHDPFLLHLLNILAHAANSALVCWLGYRLAKAPIYGLVAGLLFALYPFSYEAVPYVGSFVHPLVTLFILLTLALYLAWRARGGWGWFVGAHLALTLAVFTQENGFIAPLLILGLEISDFGFRISDLAARSTQHAARSTHHVSRPLSFLIEPVIFAVVWLLVPKSSEAGRTLLLAPARANVLPFVQALVYPVAPLACQDTTRLALIALVTLAGLYLLARALRQARLLTFGVLTWALAASPSVLLLDHAYVTGSPRLFYLGSVGVALIWAIPVRIADLGLRISDCGSRIVDLGSRISDFVSHFTSNVSRLTFHASRFTHHLSRITYHVSRITFYVLRFGFYVLLFALYLPYTTCQLRYQGYAGQVGQMMAIATNQVEPGGSVTFVNLPYFFGSRGPGTACPQPFAFAPTGAVVIPPYADAGDFAFYNGGGERATQAVAFGEYAPGWATHGDPIDVPGLRAALKTSHVFVFDLVNWWLHDLSSLWQPSMSPLPPPPIATLGNAIQLQQSEMSDPSIALRTGLESGIVVTLTWHAVAAPGRDYTVFTQWLDASGVLIEQHDGPPAGGLAPTRLWEAGDRIVDVHFIPAPADRPGGAERVIAGMYDPATGIRLEAVGPDGKRLPDDAVTLRP